MADSKDVGIEMKSSKASQEQLSERAISKRANKAGGFGTERSVYKKERENWKECCCGLSVKDWGIFLTCLVLLYGLVFGLLSAFLAWGNQTQRAVKNNDSTLWTWAFFGLSYWVIVAVLVSTGTRAAFDNAVEEDEANKA